MKIGIIREGKTPKDTRVALSPVQCRMVEDMYNDLEIIVQPSSVRCFSDKEYSDNGIKVSEDIKLCDVLMGIKEVPVSDLIEDKTYLFFSHTIKKQQHNKELLQNIINKRIRLIDYELLTNITGTRVTAFGSFAGIIGAYNGIRAYGLKYRLFRLKPVRDFLDRESLLSYLSKFSLPNIKIAVTGNGRAGQGVQQVLKALGISEATPAAFAETPYFGVPVYTILNSEDYNVRNDGAAFNKSDFHNSPQDYDSSFEKYLSKTDILMSAAYWDPKAPALFTKDDMLNPKFRIKVIADITCDINGSVPSTIRASSIENPFYNFNPFTWQEEPPFKNDKSITVMAVDNLPCELPKESSEYFGNKLIKYVIPALTNKCDPQMIEDATITSEGKLTEKFSYLNDFVNSKTLKTAIP